MEWTNQVFRYCERGLDPAFWGEPLNAVTNFAFIIAAFAALVVARRQPSGAIGTYHYLLIGLVFLIGVGSGLFHTYATQWSQVADVLPIAVFMFLYLAFAINRFLNFHLIGVVIGVGLFVLAISSLEFVKCEGGPCLNGTIGYFPALFAMLILGGVAGFRGKPAFLSLLAAGAVFAISAVFRTVDHAWCQHTQFSGRLIGTHFMWHLLNALTLFLLLRAAVLYGHNRTKKDIS